MSKTKEQLLEEFRPLFGDIEEEKASPDDTEAYMEGHFARRRIQAGIKNMFEHILSSYQSTDDMIKDATFFRSSKEELEKRLEELYTKVPGSTDTAKRDALNENAHKVIQNKELTHEQKIVQLKEIYKDDNVLLDNVEKYIKTVLSNIIEKNFVPQNINEMEEILDNLYAHYDAMETLVPDEEIMLHPYQRSVLYEKHYKSDTVNELKNKNPDDKEFTLTLDIADEICSQGTSAITNEINPVFEDAGDYENTRVKNLAKEYLEKEGLGDKISVGRQQIGVLDEDKPTYKSEVINKFLNDPFTLSEEAKNSLIYVSEMMEENNMDPMMKALTDLKDQVASSLDTGDKEKITQAVNAYNAMDNKYSEVYETLSDIKEEFTFPMNLSFGRGSGVPIKYRNDVKGASLCRSVGNAVQFCKENGVKFSELLENPLKATVDLAKKSAEEDEFINYCKKEPLNKVLQLVYAKKGDFSQLRGKMDEKSCAVGMMIGNGMASLALLAEDLGKANAESMLIFSSLSADAVMNASDFSYSNQKERMTDFIICSPNDLDPHTFGGYKGVNLDTMQPYEVFNAKQYLMDNRTSPEAVLDRITEANTALKGLGSQEKKFLQSAIKDSLSLFREAFKDRKLSKNAASVLKNLEKGTPEKISRTSKESLHAASIVTDGKTNISGFLAVDVNKSMNSLYAMSRDYDSRWFFQKWWGSETKALYETISMMKETMKEELGEELFNKKWDAASKGSLNDVMEVMPEASHGEEEINTSRVKVSEDELPELKEMEKENIAEDDLNKSFELEKGQNLVDEDDGLNNHQ